MGKNYVLLAPQRAAATPAATTTDASLIDRNPAPTNTRDNQVNDGAEETRSGEETNDFNAVYGQYPYAVDFDRANAKSKLNIVWILFYLL